MLRRHWLALLVLIPLSTAACGAEKKPEAAKNRVDELIFSMRFGTYKPAGCSFPDLRWSDIPALLKLGGSKEKTKSFPVNPLSSQWERAAPTEGVVALWLVEGIRKGGNYPSLNALLAQKGDFDRTEAAQNRALEAYQRWWKKGEKMPMEAAQKVEPLEGTGLHWY